mmetsp:Transcript_43782/g.93727  ORF Transcript_43782/g.93727 Transcript_43782/m.93727 type:complete len:112 (-) Transcript_43782:1125-1460(-)
MCTSIQQVLNADDSVWHHWRRQAASSRLVANSTNPMKKAGPEQEPSIDGLLFFFSLFYFSIYKEPKPGTMGTTEAITRRNRKVGNFAQNIGHVITSGMKEIMFPRSPGNFA